MNFTVTIKPSLNSVGKSVSSVDTNSFLQKEINTIAFGVERFGKQLSPVDTGRMRASIQTFQAMGSSLEAKVATTLSALPKYGVSYAIFVHEGTRYMRARPFLERGAKSAIEGYNENDMSRRLEAEFIKKFKYL